MPELPEVETVRRGLAPYAIGRRVEKLELRRKTLRTIIPPDLPERVAGQRIEAIDRHGKTLFWTIGDAPLIAWHLGMSGSFRIETTNDEPRKHDHAVLVLDDGTHIVFNDPRRFGHIGYAGLERHGIDPLHPDFTPAAMIDLFKGRATPIKSALLDQRLITGIGNIYACEALYDARIHPLRQTGSLIKKESTKLHETIADVLARAIASGGSSLRDHVTVEGLSGTFQHHFSVYGRKGKPCERCRTSIEAIKIAGRSTFFCPKCQAF